MSHRLMKVVSTFAAGSLLALLSFSSLLSFLSFVISTLKFEFEVSFDGEYT